MGLKQKLKRFFGIGAKEEALQRSAATTGIADRSAAAALRSAEEKQYFKELGVSTKPSPPIELQKDSLQLGVAAGYTGRALKEIESSLRRIETGMVSRDWFASQFEDRTPELIETMKKHDENISKRFESIEKLLESLKKTAEKAPEPIKTEIFEKIEAVETEMPLSPKMKRLVSVVEEVGDISYDDLCSRLGLRRSSLRGLLTKTLKRTSKLERYKIGKESRVRLRKALQEPESDSESMPEQ